MRYSITLFPERAQQTLRLLCQGKEKEEILNELSLSPNTYKKYLSDFRRYFKKNEVHAIVVLCLQFNLLEETSSSPQRNTILTHLS